MILLGQSHLSRIGVLGAAFRWWSRKYEIEKEERHRKEFAVQELEKRCAESRTESLTARKIGDE